MGINIIREPSETPNITVYNDLVPFRYAYGNQDGYAIGIGNELDGIYDNGTFTVKHGIAIIQGADIEIDANNQSIALDTASETRYYKIYLRVNLNSNIADLISYYSTTSYDDIPEQQSGELRDGGTAYLLLYSLKLNGSSQEEINKLVLPVSYSNKRLVWSGNASIGVTDPMAMSNAFAKIKEKENVTYELHGEMNEQFSNRQTFVAKIRINSHDNDGYISKCVISVDYHTSSYGNLITTTQLKIFRNGDWFFAAMLMQQLNLSSNTISYIANNATINKIYEMDE